MAKIGRIHIELIIRFLIGLLVFPKLIFLLNFGRAGADWIWAPLDLTKKPWILIHTLDKKEKKKKPALG